MCIYWDISRFVSVAICKLLFETCGDEDSAVREEVMESACSFAMEQPNIIIIAALHALLDPAVRLKVLFGCLMSDRGSVLAVWIVSHFGDGVILLRVCGTYSMCILILFLWQCDVLGDHVA